MQRIHRWRKRSSLITTGLLLAAVTGVALSMVAAASGAGTPGPPPASIGDQLRRPVPAAVANSVFTNQRGDRVPFRSFGGRVIFLVPFLTSCQEECPITAGALIALKRSLTSDGLAHRVTIVEVTVDPGRDTPDRMAAYAKLTGASWTMLTAAPTTIAALWHFFGIYYQDVPEASPPGVDWQTNRPYTYDVDHSDGFIVLDPHLRERFVAAGMARGVRLTPTLRRLLDAQGRSNLAHPGGGSWSIADARHTIGWLLGRPVR